jgi:GDP-L-fucose synthase
MHVDDLADALVFLLQHFSEPGPINVGTGTDVTIVDLAHLVAEAVGYRGQLVFDRSMPDGTPRKLMDGRKLAALGWKSRIGLRQGLADTISMLPVDFGRGA